jgi:hypothetical protein
MTTLDLLAEPLARLFIRIDAAGPTDELLQRIAAFWQQSRSGKIAPQESDMAGLPKELQTHAFVARISSNGTRHWLISRPGAIAAGIFTVRDGFPLNDADKRSAVRLRRLFNLVDAKEEPHAAMFEIKDEDGKTRLIEIFAAPLRGQVEATHAVFAAANSRIELR